MNKSCDNCKNRERRAECDICLVRHDSVPSRWIPADDYVPDTIRERAADEIRKRACINRRSVSEELDVLGLYRELFWRWEHLTSDPSAFYLQKMAIAGYDVDYILTGRRHDSQQ